MGHLHVFATVYLPTDISFVPLQTCNRFWGGRCHREVNAVDSEHSKNLSSDPWRQMQLAKHMSNPSHPWSHFATGEEEEEKVGQWDGHENGHEDV